ncbi:MAG: ABC transporter substrate binding protein [Bdellovibrionota bacterium]
MTFFSTSTGTRLLFLLATAINILSISIDAQAASFRILTIKSDTSTFAKQFFAGFSSSTPEKVIAFDYFGDNGRVLSRKVKEISPDLVLTIGELPIFSSVSDFPSTPFLVSNFQSSSLESRNNVILINHSISMQQKISMLTFLFPNIKTIGTVYDPVYSKETFDSFALAATNLGLKVLSIKVSSDKEVSSFIQGFKGQQDPTSKNSASKQD